MLRKEVATKLRCIKKKNISCECYSVKCETYFHSVAPIHEVIRTSNYVTFSIDLSKIKMRYYLRAFSGINNVHSICSLFLYYLLNYCEDTYCTDVSGEENSFTFTL